MKDPAQAQRLVNQGRRAIEIDVGRTFRQARELGEPQVIGRGLGSNQQRHVDAPLEQPCNDGAADQPGSEPFRVVEQRL